MVSSQTLCTSGIEQVRQPIEQIDTISAVCAPFGWQGHSTDQARFRALMHNELKPIWVQGIAACFLPNRGTLDEEG